MRRVKSESLRLVEVFFDNPLMLMKLEEPQKHGNMVVIPLVLKGSHLDFMCVSEAEDKGKIRIIETDNVNELKVVNMSDEMVLIPFGVTVHGGKQDRTVWEPILLPPGVKQRIFETRRTGMGAERKVSIPAKCIEQSRWSYKKGRDFRAAKVRLNPNVAFMAMSPAGQSAVWSEIDALRYEMNVDINETPTQSYLDITKAREKSIDSLVNRFENVKDQCGVAVFINGEFIGAEFYGNLRAWMVMGEEVLRAFAVEALRARGKPMREVGDHYHNVFIKTMGSVRMDFTVRKGVALGDVVEFESEDGRWRGIALGYKNTIVQFYLVRREDAGKLEISNFQRNVERISRRNFQQFVGESEYPT